MPNRDDGPRACGPYWSEARQRYFNKVYVPSRETGKLVPRFRWMGQDEQEAKDDLADAWKEIAARQGVTFDKALAAYRKFLVETGHKKPNTEDSADETCRRLRLFFDDVLDLQVSRLTDERGEELYRAFAARTYTVGSKKRGTLREKPYQPGHHRQLLAQAKTFTAWCVKPKGWAKFNSLEEVRGIGDVNDGKEQHTGTEAQTFYKWCVFKATRGDDAALGLLLCELMRRRVSDIRLRVVRDVDLDGTVLRFSKTKSKKGNVPEEIPVDLQPLVRQRIEGRGPLEPLFPAADGGFHGESWLRSAAHRLCAGAGVPYIPPHGLKGTAATLAATELGLWGDALARFLKHEKASTGERHYAAEGAVQVAAARAGMKVITGGKQ